MDRVETMQRKVLTLKEVSTFLRVHPSTPYRLIKNSELPAFRVESEWRFMRESIDRWVAEIESAGSAATSSKKTDTARQGPASKRLESLCEGWEAQDCARRRDGRGGHLNFPC